MMSSSPPNSPRLETRHIQESTLLNPTTSQLSEDSKSLNSVVNRSDSAVVSLPDNTTSISQGHQEQKLSNQVQKRQFNDINTTQTQTSLIVDDVRIVGSSQPKSQITPPVSDYGTVSSTISPVNNIGEKRLPFPSPGNGRGSQSEDHKAEHNLNQNLMKIQSQPDVSENQMQISNNIQNININQSPGNLSITPKVVIPRNQEIGSISPSIESLRKKAEINAEKSITDPIELLKTAYKVTQPELGWVESMLANIFGLKEKAALSWVMTQTGVNSVILILALRQLTRFFPQTKDPKRFIGGLISYLVFAHLNPAKHNGAIRMEMVRHSSYFRLLSAYYPHRNVMTVPLQAKNGPYLFAMHPHGVLALTLAPTFAEGTGFESKLFGNELRVQVCTIDLPFYMIGADYFSMTAGLITNHKDKIAKNLEKGNSIGIYVGGADEALLSGGGKLRVILKNRMGFVQIAVATGTSLVPCLALGETGTFRQVFGKKTRAIQKMMQETIPGGVTMPVFGNGEQEHIDAKIGRQKIDFKTKLGMNRYVPRQHPTFTVMGAPIHVGEKIDRKKEPKRFEQQVQKIHELYCKKLRELHAKWKHLGTAEDQELELVSAEEARNPNMLKELQIGQAKMDLLKDKGQYNMKRYNELSKL